MFALKSTMTLAKTLTAMSRGLSLFKFLLHLVQTIEASVTSDTSDGQLFLSQFDHCSISSCVTLHVLTAHEWQAMDPEEAEMMVEDSKARFGLWMPFVQVCTPAPTWHFVLFIMNVCRLNCTIDLNTGIHGLADPPFPSLSILTCPNLFCRTQLNLPKVVLWNGSMEKVWLSQRSMWRSWTIAAQLQRRQLWDT
jgi:hypothetical protein